MIGKNAQIGKRVYVLHEFEEDHVLFKQGRSGVIKKINWGGEDYVLSLGIEWDFRAPSFHTCGGKCEPDQGYYIYQHNFGSLGMSKKQGNIGLYWGDK